MASNFIERHRRKTVAGALLFFLKKGRGIIPLLLIIVLISVPFIVPGSTLVRVPGVAVFMGAIGIGPASRWSREHAFSAFRSALEKAAQRGREGSFWNSVFRRMVSALPSDQSSIALVVGGREIADSHKVSLLVSKPKSIKGVAGPDEKGRKMEGVYLGDILPDYGQAGMGDMNVLGVNTPYYSAGRKPFPAVADAGSEFFGGVLASAGGNAPTPVGPARSRARMGRLSNFAWRNLSFSMHSKSMGARIFRDGALFRLAETFAMTEIASTKGGAPEYQATYVGATYDGTETDDDLLMTEPGAVDVPDTEAALTLMQGVEDLSELAKRCADAQADEGAKMSELSDEMDIKGRELESMGQPGCCEHGKVDKWNGTVNEITQLCGEFNANAAILSQECHVGVSDPAPSTGDEHQDMDCGSYSGMIVAKCYFPSWKWDVCFLGAVFGFGY